MTTQLENDIGAVLARKLLTVDDVTQLIGTRIYPEVLPQNADLPAVCYSLMSETSEATISDPAGMAEARVQFDCMAKTAIESRQLKNRIRAAIHARQFLQDETYVRSVRHENTQSFFLQDIVDGGAYVTSVDFHCIYKET
jgi:hypothetical protein